MLSPSGDNAEAKHWQVWLPVLMILHEHNKDYSLFINLFSLNIWQLIDCSCVLGGKTESFWYLCDAAF